MSEDTTADDPIDAPDDPTDVPTDATEAPGGTDDPAVDGDDAEETDDVPAVADGTPAQRIARLERTVSVMAERLLELESPSRRSRRSVLGLLGAGGLLGLGAGTAGADPQGQLGTPNDPLRDLYTLNVQSPQAQLQFYVGGSLAGALRFDGQDPDVAIGVRHSLPNASAGRTIAGGASHYVSGEFATVSGGFGSRASGYRSTVGGGNNQEASDHYATVGGGIANTASFSRATVAGGGSNTADGGGATVGGGTNNLADGYQSTVAGGGDRDDESRGNAAYTNHSTVAGGTDNEAGTEGQINVNVAATVGGGEGNTASADHATVPGGEGNSATAPNAFAAGTNASADHEGSFVWCDTSSGGLSSLNPNEFAVSAAGGVFFFSNESATTGVELSSGSGSWASASSRALKSDVEPVPGEDVLDRVTDLEISRWSYDSQPGVRHMGPMAEEFSEAFGLGDDEGRISNVDADGVALGAIQGLAERGEERDATVEAQRERIDALERENRDLRERLDALEARVGGSDAGPA